MKLIRPVGLLRDAGWEAGAVRPMKMAELGIEGLATIVSVEPCPAIQPGRGRVIAGTITHLNGQLLQLKLRGLDEPMEVTEPHRFYSEDRLDWVAAKELRVGERLRRRGGAVAVVEAVKKLPGVYRVYNVEVEGEQQYFVSGLDVLVHNWCPTEGYNGPQSAAELPPEEVRMLQVIDGVAPQEADGALRANDVTTYADAAARAVPDDNLEAHELWQHANLNENGLAGERLSTPASQDNPVIMLDRAVHQQLTAAQYAWNARTMTPIENINANAALMRLLNAAPDSAITQAQNMALAHAHSLGF